MGSGSLDKAGWEGPAMISPFFITAGDRAECEHGTWEGRLSDDACEVMISSGLTPLITLVEVPAARERCGLETRLGFTGLSGAILLGVANSEDDGPGRVPIDGACIFCTFETSAWTFCDCFAFFQFSLSTLASDRRRLVLGRVFGIGRRGTAGNEPVLATWWDVDCGGVTEVC